MNLPKLPKKIQSRRFILPVMLLLVGALAGGGWLYKHRQNRLSLQSKQEAVVAAMEEGKLARQATVKTVDSTAAALEQQAVAATPQPTAPKTGQHPGAVIIDNKHKGIKLIQGGSFIPDQGSITYSKGQPYPSVTFTTNDGTAVPFPSKPWSDSRPYGVVSLSSIPQDKRSAWTVHIDASNMPAGTFRAEVLSTVNDGQGNTVQYTGSVAVTVVE